MKQSVRKYWNIGGFTSFRRVTWNRWIRGVGRVVVKSWMRKPKTRGITWQKANFWWGHQRY